LQNWPSCGDPQMSNPMTVELHLRKVIKEAQVSLLGELDLDSPTSWAGTNWSLSQLAEYVFSFPALKLSLTSGINTKARRDGSPEKSSAVIYPATIAIWSVAQAQHLETGQELWTTADLTPNQINALPYKFEDSIRTLELEAFDGKLSEQKRVSLARFHAIVPNYAIEEFVRVIRRCEEQHTSALSTLDVIANTQTLAISVKGLFDARPDIAVDVIQRAFRTLRTGESAGLPPRISRVLSSQVSRKRVSTLSTHGEAPTIGFDESVGELYIKGHSGWKLFDENHVEIDHSFLPPRNLFAQHLNGSTTPLLNLDDGYLLLSRNLDVVRNGSNLPRDGAFIWHKSVSFDNGSIATEPSSISGWDDWFFALLKPLDKLNLKLSDGRIRTLGKSKEIEVYGEPIPGLITADGFVIFSESPRLVAGQNVTISSNTDHSSRKSTGQEEFLVEENGHFDLSLYAGLGRSMNIKGFLLRGFSISDIDFPLFENEKRTINLIYSTHFAGPSSVVIDSDSGKSPVIITETSTGRKIPILINVPTFEWSLLMDGREPQRFRKSAKLSTKELAKVRRLVIQDSSKLNVKLQIRTQESHVMDVTPRIRDNSMMFDLRLLGDGNAEAEYEIEIEARGKRHTLFSFTKVSSQTASKGVRITDLRKLAEGWILVGGMTQQEWDSYQEEMKRYSREVMAAYRLRRGQRR